MLLPSAIVRVAVVVIVSLRVVDVVGAFSLGTVACGLVLLVLLLLRLVGESVHLGG